MIGSHRTTCVPSKNGPLTREQRIRDLNDQLRRSARSGIICLTAGVRALGEHGVQAALAAVRDFDAFPADNEPHEEHDSGTFRLLGTKLVWRIDYYDRQRRFGSPDRADPAVTTRVLKIMLAREWSWREPPSYIPWATV